MSESLFDVAEQEAKAAEQDEQIENDPALTFLPIPLAKNESPLNQYVPFRVLPPEERACLSDMYQKLTVKQQRFVLVYLQSWSPTQAARETGQPSSLVDHPMIQPILQFLKRADQLYLAKHSGITRTRFLEELQAIAFFDPAEMYDENNTIKPVREMSRHTRIALQVAEKINNFSETNTDGHTHSRTKKDTKVNAYEKLGALKIFGDMMGFVMETPKVTTDKPIQVEFIEANHKRFDDPPVKKVTDQKDGHEPYHPPGSLSEEVIWTVPTL